MRRLLTLLAVSVLTMTSIGLMTASAQAQISEVCFDKPGDPYYRAYIGPCDEGDFGPDFDAGQEVVVRYQYDGAMKYYSSFPWVRGTLLTGDGSVDVCVFSYSRYTPDGWGPVRDWIHRYDGSCAGGYHAVI